MCNYVVIVSIISLLTLVLGGCGAMYAISVVSSEFKGKNILNQHRMVTEVCNYIIK